MRLGINEIECVLTFLFIGLFNTKAKLFLTNKNYVINNMNHCKDIISYHKLHWMKLKWYYYRGKYLNVKSYFYSRLWYFDNQ